jgi:hypothetical protein
MARIGRRGFEIAIGTLVVMILGILVVGGGTLLVYKVVQGGKDVVGKLPQQCEYLRKTMPEGQLVTACPADQTVTGGESVTYGIAVENKLTAATSFGVWVQAFNSSGDEITGKNDCKSASTKAWCWYNLNITGLQPLKTEVANLIVRPGRSVPAGEYTFIVTISYLGASNVRTAYDSARSFTMRVQ